MKGLVSLVGDPTQNYGNELQEIFLFEGNLSKAGELIVFVNVRCVWVPHESIL